MFLTLKSILIISDLSSHHDMPRPVVTLCQLYRILFNSTDTISNNNNTHNNELFMVLLS